MLKTLHFLALILTAGCIPLPAGEPKQTLNISVKNQVLHSLNPRLFGQFMERPAFSGETGPEAAILPGTHQLQPKAEELIRNMKIPVLRFPGGTDVDFLDWTDMIDHAPGRKSPTRPGSEPRGKKVTNAFGYDEFLQLCKRNGSEAIIVVNFRDGLMNVKSLEEAAAHAAALVAYCNAPVDQPLPPELAKWARLRAENGHPAPYHVKYFQIGNETWMFNPEVEKKFAADPLAHWQKCLHAYIKAIQAVDPTAKIIVDSFPLAVSQKIHEEFQDAIHGFAVHRYHPWDIRKVLKDGHEVKLSDVSAEDIWKTWVAAPSVDAQGQATLEDENFAQARQLGYKISLTEWNWNGWWAVKNQKPALDSAWAKGIGAASFLHAILRQGDLINLGIQSMLIGKRWEITAIRVDEKNKIPPYMLPTGMVTQLYSQNHGDLMLQVDLSNSDSYEQPYKMSGLGPATKVAYVDVIATRSAKNLFVHMINRRFQDKQSTKLDCSDFDIQPQSVELLILEGRLDDAPHSGEPITPASLRYEKIPFTGNPLEINLPARSVVFAKFSL